MKTTESTPKYIVSVPDGCDYVLVRVRANVDRSIARQYMKEAVQLGRERRLRKILKDLRGYRSTSDTLDKYSFAYEEARDILIEPGWKVAVLCDVITKDMKFLETVMLNAGHTYRVFDTGAAALAWLAE